MDLPGKANGRFNIFLSGLFVIIVASGWFALEKIKSITIDEHIQTNIAKTNELAKRVDSWLAVRKTEIQTLGNTPIVRTMNWTQSGPFLKAKHQAMPWFYIFAHINPDGTYYNSKVDYAKGRNLKDRAHFKASIAGNVYASDPVVSRTLGTDIVAVTSPIFNSDGPDKKILGVFGGMIDTKTIVKELSLFTNGPGSYAFALNSTGIAISHPDDRRRGNINNRAISLTKDKDPGLALAAITMLKGEPGWLSTVVDGVDGYVTYAPLSQAKWTVGTFTEASWINQGAVLLDWAGVVVLILLMAIFFMVFRVRALETAALEADKALSDEKSNAKSLFIANMSHELRTPLNGIIGYSQMLMGEKGRSKQERDRLNTILKSGRHLLGMINGILDLSKIESGRIEIDEKPTDLKAFLNDLVSLLSFEGKNYSTTLNSKISDDFPPAVMIDPERLTQILTNVVVNAFKYGGGKPVSANVTYLQQASNGFLDITVADKGVGMNKAQIERAFTPFEQSDARSSGAGLGLAIVKELISRMGGTINLDSQEREGTTVNIQIPVATTDRLPLGSVIGTKDGQKIPVGIIGQKQSALIVDDNQTNRDFFSDLLKGAGFNVSVADCVDAAFTKFKSEHFDLVLTDLVMPEKSGIELITIIRKEATNSDVAIVVASASAFPEDKVRCVAAGANSFIVKPIDPEALFDELEILLGIQFEYEVKDNYIDEAQNEGQALQNFKNLQIDQNYLETIFEVIQTVIDRGQILSLEKSLDDLSDEDLKQCLKSVFAPAIDSLDFEIAEKTLLTLRELAIKK